MTSEKKRNKSVQSAAKKNNLMPKTNLIVDGHVHIYDCGDLDKFFDMAINNMDNMYKSIYPEDNNYQKALLFTEGKNNDYFSRFKANDNFGKHSEYKFENIQEDCSLILSKNNEPRCYIISGRQIVTREKLEVLSIASSQNIEDGLSIEDVVKKLLDNQQIVIINWGVGKRFLNKNKGVILFFGMSISLT